MEENNIKSRNDSFGLNIWWSLNILRDTVEEIYGDIKGTLAIHSQKK
jgi:hypothetical protein